jgi:hypothetical protein
MAAKFIVNQDRDIIIPFDPNVRIYITSVIVDDIDYGVNLMHGSVCLGSFWKPSEAVKEVSSIYNCMNEIYVVKGFSEGGFDNWLL